jgi:putative intracellular protease/amidase
VDTTPPVVNRTGSLWWDTEEGRLYLRYNNAWVDASPNTGSTSDLGKFIFDVDTPSATAFIHTTNDAGGTDGYDIVLIPGGEGESSIRVPKYTNALAGDPLVIAATAANSAVVINTDHGSWTFGNTGTTTFPNNTIKAPDDSELKLYVESGNNYSYTSQTGTICKPM